MTPPARPVRPRTRPGRLAALDAWLCAEGRALLDGRGAVVDVGYGLSPATTLELARAVRAVTPSLRVVGVERAAAPPVEGVELLAGDFSTCASLAPCAVVRAMNVVRGYREEEVPAIHEALGAGLVEGGLVIEGSTDTEGHVTVAHLLRRKTGRLVREALLFYTDGARGFSPWLFRDWLPRDLRRRATPGSAVHGFLEAWAAAVRGDEPRARFLAALDAVPHLAATAWERSHGFARWVGLASPKAQGGH